MYLASRIDEESAREILVQKQSLLFKKMKTEKAPLKKIEMLYLPFYLFLIKMDQEGDIFEIMLSVDALDGNPAFFKTQLIAAETMPTTIVSRCSIQPEAAEKIASDYCRGYFLERGLKVKHHAVLKTMRMIDKIYFPFWVGYFLKGKRYDFKVMDAVSGTIEGIRMRKVFLKAFRILDETF